MGFLGKMMGMGGAKSDSKKQEIRAIFNSKVNEGDSYTVLAGMNQVLEKKLLKDVYTYYNYIVGYKDGDDPEVVIIPVNSDLSVVEDAVCCKKRECTKAEYSEKVAMFTITHPAFGNDPVRFAVIASTMMGSYVIKVSYVDEFMPFMEFFKNRFAK